MNVNNDSTDAAPAEMPPSTAANANANANANLEDNNHEEGTELATFCAYQPTALPPAVVQAFNNNAINAETDATRSITIITPCDSTSTSSTTTSDHDNDDTASIEVGSQTPQQATTVTLQVPSHTSPACESNLLSSVPAPPLHIQEHKHEQDANAHPNHLAACVLPLLIQQQQQQQLGKQRPALSPLQMEGVLLALQRHRRIFTCSGDSYRAGFFLGDGAGIGKGRQIAAILRDSLCRKSNQENSTTTANHHNVHHTKRHLWLSVSRELIQDARRDLKDVGVHADVIHDGSVLLDKSKHALGQNPKGVMFLTYSFLISKKRLEQIVTWCAGTHLLTSNSSKLSAKKAQLEQSFSGCIIFDEAHKAKNIANDTKTAQLVLQLQRRLPNARVVYCSATGVSDVAHLAYAERLGLWDNSHGDNNNNSKDSAATTSTHNFANFAAFQNSLTSRGLGSLELLALELKQQGSFLARTLSWDGAEFQSSQVELTRAQRRVYDQSVQWWNTCRSYIETALTKVQEPETGSKSLLWRIFWSSHQRFFRELAICAKVEFLAKDALKQVHEHGRCVVIGLQSTGESGMQSIMEGYSSGNGKHVGMFQDQHFPALISTLKATLTNFVQKNFPVTPEPPEPPKLPDQPPAPTASEDERQQYAIIESQIARIAAMPPPEPLPALLEMRQSLMDAIKTLDLPPNPLDDLIDRLGGVDQVAEMTGRSGRMVRAPGRDYFIFSKRVTDGSRNGSSAVDSDRLNLVERRKFQDGEKAFAIISDAASTGISLHAAQGSGGSHKRRVHYTIELPWSADKAVQQLGRSHRSGQESAPIYNLVVTSLGGERRFAAAVTKRMSALGALCKGDRRAATGGDMFADFDLDSKYGKRALKEMYKALDNNERFLNDPSDGFISVSSTMPSRNTKAILADFADQMTRDKDPMVATLPETEVVRNSVLLSVAISELELVGIDSENRKKADVRMFLNRLAGLPVIRQGFVFRLFMSTLEDVILGAKTTGEFEGTAEDIKATNIEIGKEIDLAVDPASGAQTKLTILTLDRGISLEAVSSMALEEAQKAKKPKDVLEEDAPEESDSEQDEWLSKESRKDNIAPQGFYVSRNKIVGRHFILYAKHKFDRSEFVSGAAAYDFDPFGLMVITRPNTGSGSEMNTQDLKRKYRLVLDCDRGITSSPGNETKSVEVIRRTSAEVSTLWKCAYEESNYDTHQNGLAPRRGEVALVTGPCLHVLPALEKAVLHRSEKDRALKIMRAQVDGRRIVGVRFPREHDAIQMLQSELAKLLNARKKSDNAFIDEDLAPICAKSLEWTTTERKTVKSFFAVKNTPANGPTKSVTPVPSSAAAADGGKRKQSPDSAKTKTSNKKTKSIASFFAPAKKN